MTPTSASESVTRRRAVVLLALIAGLGLIFRTYQLSGLSFWYDEYLSGLAYANAPSWSTFFALVNSMGKHASPFLYGAFYLWMRLVGGDPVKCRLFSVVFGMLALPLIFAIGARLSGRRCGLLAALILALAPVHIWYSHAFRPYAMLMFLGLLSLYCLIQALEGKGLVWWAGTCMANILLVLIQPTEAVFVFAQGCCLLWRFRHRIRVVVLWALPQALVMVPWLARMFAAGSVNVEHQMRMDGNLFWQFLTNTGIGNLTLSAPDWFGSESASTTALDAFWLLQKGFALSLWVLVAVVATHMLRRRNFDRTAGLLTVIAVVPPSILGVLTAITQMPFLRPRYTLCSYLLCYVLLAWLITRAPRPHLRTVLASVLITALGYQAVVLAWASPRMEWKSAGRFLASHAGPEDLLICADELTASILRFNSGSIGSLPVVCSRNFQTTCDTTSLLLAGGDTPRTAWLLYGCNWDRSNFSELEQTLESHGLSVSYHPFLGHDHLALFGVRGPAQRLAPGSEAEVFSRHANFLRERDERAEAAMPSEVMPGTACRFRHDPPPFDSTILAPSSLVQLVRLGRTDEAWAVVALLAQDPMETALLTTFIALAEGRRLPASERTADLPPEMEPFIAPLIAKLLEGDALGAIQEAEWLNHLNFAFAAQIVQLCRSFVMEDGPRLPLGIVPAAGGTPEQVLARFSTVHPSNLKHPVALLSLAETLLFMGRDGEAAEAGEQSLNLIQRLSTMEEAEPSAVAYVADRSQLVLDDIRRRQPAATADGR